MIISAHLKWYSSKLPVKLLHQSTYSRVGRKDLVLDECVLRITTITHVPANLVYWGIKYSLLIAGQRHSTAGVTRFTICLFWNTNSIIKSHCSVVFFIPLNKKCFCAFSQFSNFLKVLYTYLQFSSTIWVILDWFLFFDLRQFIIGV